VVGTFLVEVLVTSLTLESLLEEPKQQLSTIVAEDSSSVGIDRQNMGTYSVVEFLFGIS
jgi:hypothetical protein